MILKQQLKEIIEYLKNYKNEIEEKKNEKIINGNNENKNNYNSYEPPYLNTSGATKPGVPEWTKFPPTSLTPKSPILIFILVVSPGTYLLARNIFHILNHHG